MTYKAKVGLNYPGPNGTNKRVEAGEMAIGLPSESVSWLLERGMIEATGKTPAKVEPVIKPTPVVKPITTAKVAEDKEPA